MGFLEKKIFSCSVERKFFYSNIGISLGVLLAASSGGWDITYHVLNKPETFFSPPHFLLYTGIFTSFIGTIIMFFQWNQFLDKQRSKFRFSVKIGIIGIFFLMSAGPIDFFWHNNFGLDGLLSPPHQIMILGMFLCSIGSMISILRYEKLRKDKPDLSHSLLISLSLLSVWGASLGFLYSFSLPFSKTDFFNFNPDIYFAATFAAFSLPFLNSSILVLTSKLASHKFGILSITGIIFLLINLSNSVLPNHDLFAFIPFYILNIIPFIVADIIITISNRRIFIYVAGAIIGVSFYFFYFPLIAHVYNEVVYDRMISGSLTANVYFEILPIIMPLIVGPAIIGGVFGARFAEKIISRLF